MTISTLGWVAIGTGIAVTVVVVAVVVTRPPEVLPSYAGDGGQAPATDAGAELARSLGNLGGRVTDAVAQANAAEAARRARQQEADIRQRELDAADRRAREAAANARANPAAPTANQR